MDCPTENIESRRRLALGERQFGPLREMSLVARSPRGGGPVQYLYRFTLRTRQVVELEAGRIGRVRAEGRPRRSPPAPRRNRPGR